MSVWGPSLTGRLATPAVNAADVTLVADDLRETARWINAALPIVDPAPADWRGFAAEAYTAWVAHVDSVLDAVFGAVNSAVGVLDDIAETTGQAHRQISDLQWEFDWMQLAPDPAAQTQICARAAEVLERQRDAEAQAAATIRDITARLPGAPPPICRAPPTPHVVWTDQQTRDLVRGIGDTAWDAGPGTVSALLRWTTIPGLLGAYNSLDEVENDTKVRLDEWGRGRTDTRTNQAAYGSTSVATAFLPGPQGKTGIASWAGRAAARHLARIAELGWHGDGTLHLTPTELTAVSDHFTRAVDVEPRVTALMDQARRGLPDVHAIGREHVLKAPESLCRKVATLLEKSFIRNVGAELAELNDSVRYTFAASAGMLVDQTNFITSRLQSSGLKPTKWTSSWDGDGYQGINSTWRHESGHLVEVQFHTPASAWAKEYTHPAYDIIRLPSTARKERKAMKLLQTEIFSQVSPPAGLERLANRVDFWS